ncbi:MAG: zinc ribbon domain-containing protein [Thermoleophilia bacterium]|nr:zinc ribbon domain-containing protein [Thermoleophilia bacterium]
MASRFSALFTRRPTEAAPGAVGEERGAGAGSRAASLARGLPLGRERRELSRLRELELRDVGGLAVEMARRSDWRYALLHARCADVLAIEERIHELDALIAAGEMVARGVPAVQCACGAPILRGSHFCANCGRPAPETPPVVTCSHCGHALPAEANFCASCGNAVAAEAFAEAQALDDTAAPSPPRRAGDA